MEPVTTDLAVDDFHPFFIDGCSIERVVAGIRPHVRRICPQMYCTNAVQNRRGE